jgi:hypothetical protein
LWGKKVPNKNGSKGSLNALSKMTKIAHGKLPPDEATSEYSRNQTEI